MKEKIQKAAQEYADRHFLKDVEGLLNKPWPEAKEHYKKMLESFTRELSGDLYLVEKSKVKETWKQITNVYLAHNHITYDGARYLFEEVLFPESAKEVEG